MPSTGAAMGTSQPVAGAPAKLEKKPVKFSNLLRASLKPRSSFDLVGKVSADDTVVQSVPV